MADAVNEYCGVLLTELLLLAVAFDLCEVLARILVDHVRLWTEHDDMKEKMGRTV